MGTPLDSKETRMKDLNNMIKHFEERIEECRNEIRILQGQTTLAQEVKVREMEELREHDIVRFKKENEGYLPGVRFTGKITGFSKDGERAGIEENHYNGCGGQLTGGSYYSIPREWITEVQRWVPVSHRREGS